jgi:CMP-N,N'-diacetyllegionaminic acid synthase
MSRTIKAIVPVRSGSIRVANKNLKPFSGSTLLELRVKQLMTLPFLDGVVVSSNDPEMLRVASELGAETHERDPYFASNTVSMSEVYENMASAVAADDIMYALVTTPLVTNESFIQAFQQFRNLPEGYDSITTVADVKEFLLQDGKPLNYDGNKIPRSQDLPEIVKLTFCISMLPRTTMIEKRSCLGKKPFYLRLSQQESVDIDTPFDFDMAELLYQKYVLGNANA